MTVTKQTAKFISVVVAFITLYACSPDSENKEAASLDFTDIYSIQVDSLDLDMISAPNQNALYVTYSADNGYNENVLKYDLATQTPTTIVHPDLSEGRQIEIVDNMIYSMAANDVCRYDLNLDNVMDIGYGSGYAYQRALTINNEIMFFTGVGYTVGYDAALNSFAWSNSTGNDFWLRADSEAFGNKVYCFGGSYYTNQGETVMYPKIHVLDLASDTWTQQNLPYDIYESFTAVYGNSIIVAGNKSADSSNAFLAVYDPVSGSFTDLDMTLDLASVTIRGVAIINQDLYIAYADAGFAFPGVATVKIAKATLQ